MSVNKKRAFDEDASKRKKQSTDLGRRTGDFGPLHPMVRDGYNDARSRFSEVPEGLLAMVLSPYIFARDGHHIMPGLMDITPSDDAPEVIAAHDFDWTGDALFESSFDILPTNNLLMHLADRRRLGRKCSPLDALVFEQVEPCDLVDRRIQFARVVCECDDSYGADPRQIIPNTVAGCRDPCGGPMVVLVDSLTGKYEEWIAGTRICAKALPDILNSNTVGRRLFLEAVCVDRRGSVCIAWTRSDSPFVDFAVLELGARALNVRRRFKLAGFTTVLGMRIDVNGDLVVLGQSDKYPFDPTHKIRQYIRIFKTGNCKL